MTLRMSRARRIDIGKRAAVTSGLLGTLCVLAELCFLLPDALVTRDALPFYQAHIDLFRGILQVTILATFACGALGLWLLRSKGHALLGIGLGVVALMMGGAHVQAIDLGRGAFSVGIFRAGPLERGATPGLHRDAEVRLVPIAQPRRVG